MNDDRELLRLAAIAIGQRHDDEHEILVFGEGLDPGVQRRWNPLENDGDALRLAVKLGLILSVSRPEVRHRSTIARRENEGRGIEIMHGQDADSATRRAIVRAAAAIGKEMQ